MGQKDYGMKLNQYKMIVKVTPAKVHTIAREANINKTFFFDLERAKRQFYLSFFLHCFLGYMVNLYPYSNLWKTDKSPRIKLFDKFL